VNWTFEAEISAVDRTLTVSADLTRSVTVRYRWADQPSWPFSHSIHQ